MRALLLVLAFACPAFPASQICTVVVDGVTYSGEVPSISWTPASLNPTAWYDPADAATVHATGVLVDQIDDKSGNGYHMLQTGSARPTYSATAIMGKPGIVGVGSQTMKAAGVSIGTNKFSAFSLASVATAGYSRLLSFRANGDAGDWFGNSVTLLSFDAVKNLQSYGSANLSGSNTIPIVGSTHGGVQQLNQPLMPGVFLRIGTVFDGANQTLYVDNIAADPVAFSRNVTPGTLSIMGRDDGSYGWTGTMGETIVLNRDATADERQKIHQWLVRHWARVLVVEGDSLPHAGPPDGYTYAANLTTSTFLDNVAVGGSNLNNYTASDPAPTRFGTLTYRAPFHLYNRIPADKQGRQYVLFFAVTNNLGSGGVTAYAEAWGQYALDAKAAGFDKVVTSTVLSRTDSQATDTVRNALNAILRDSAWRAAHGIDALADFAADSIMGVDAAPTVNPTYFADGVHPSAAGNARLTPIFTATLNGLSP